jgi:hypothetical protein
LSAGGDVDVAVGFPLVGGCNEVATRTSGSLKSITLKVNNDTATTPYTTNINGKLMAKTSCSGKGTQSHFSVGNPHNSKFGKRQ